MKIVRDVNHSTQQSPTVVVLCAEEELRDVITYWFTSLSIHTVATTDGYHANRILKTTTVGLLVTDRILPPWPGLDTFRQLRAANPRLRVAFVTRPLSRYRVVEALGLPEFVP